MKRSARVLEEQLVAYSTVQVAPEAELGALVLYTFFSATDALLDALRERPLLILRLMQTNKAMSKLWDQVPRLWPVLVDAVVARVYGDEWVAPYAFLVVQARRDKARAREIRRSVDWVAISDAGLGLEGLEREIDIPLSRAAASHRHALKQLGQQFAFCLWEPLMPLFCTTLRQYRHVFFDLPRDLIGDLTRFTLDGANDTAYVWCGDALCVPTRVSAAQLLRMIMQWTQHTVGRLSLITHGPLLGSTVEVTYSRRGVVGPVHTFYPIGLVRAIDTVTRQLDQMQYYLNMFYKTLPAPDDPGFDAAVNEALPLLALEDARITQYRELLWRDIFAEPEAQRAYLVELARAIAWRDDVVQSLSTPLHCAACARPTALVDTQQMLPFCEDALCAQLYAQCVT